MEELDDFRRRREDHFSSLTKSEQRMAAPPGEPRRAAWLPAAKKEQRLREASLLDLLDVPIFR